MATFLEALGDRKCHFFSFSFKLVAFSDTFIGQVSKISLHTKQIQHAATKYGFVLENTQSVRF